MNHPEHNIEMIMKIFSRFSDTCIQDLAPPEYNAVYSHVAKCLLTIHNQLQRRCRLMEIALGRIANEPPENAKRIAENVMKEVDGGKDN